MKMKSKIHVMLLMMGALLFVASQPARPLSRASDEAEVRSTVRTIFEQLRSGQYSELYDALPSASRARISRARFIEMLRRTSNIYKLNRLEVSAVRVSGDIAVVDTAMYGSVSRPVETEGKIVAQQYMVREGGAWRVATGDRATVRRFLASNPAFAKKFPIREPRIYVKREGRWVDVTKTLQFATRQRPTK